MPKILDRFFTVVCVTLLFIANIQKVSAQRIEVGASLGVANYVGDLAPTMVLSETKPAFSLYGRYAFSSSFAFKGEINFTSVAGSDKNFDFNTPRNLSFRSNIREFAGTIEFNFNKYGLGVLDKKFTTFVFIGLAMFQYNPQTYFEGHWIDLRGVKTEGKSYGTSSMAIPFGMGVKWRVSRKFAFETSVGFRKTYTDYLDDVSGTYIDYYEQQKNKGVVAAMLGDRSAEVNNGVPQNKAGYRRGNADFNDWYIIANVSLSYRIFNRLKCARFY